MGSRIQTNFSIRHSFGRIKQIIEVPNLIEIQKKSYEEFLQANVPPSQRKDVGLQGVFKSVFPIKDYNGMYELIFTGYTLEKPKYDVEECIQRGLTYAAPLKVTVQLIVYDNGSDGSERTIRNIKEQEVYFGEIPLMTESGTFVINGTERVIVSQLHRSPGVFFDDDKGKTHSSGKILHQARVIPYRGSWLDFEFDPRDLIYVRIDRKRKMPVTVLLKALGYSVEELLRFFYDIETIHTGKDGTFWMEVDYNLLLNRRATRDVFVNGELIVQRSRRFNQKVIRKMKELGITRLPLERHEVIGKVAASRVVDPETGELILDCNEEVKEGTLEKIQAAGISSFQVLFIDGFNVGGYLRETLLIDKVNTKEEAILEIYRRMRPTEPSTIETAKTFFHNLFFNPDRYDLSKVGRLKLNLKFYKEDDPNRPPLDMTVLTPLDILHTVKYLIEVKHGRGMIDDIDHLGNRRVRAVGELLENQYRVGLARMERAIRERMNMQEVDTLMPHHLINQKPVSAAIKEYFGSSQLSQFMDQTNPLSEVTHKRRLSALGPGGLTRERAGYEVRDVHPSHYGRICPIETPEGQNIGLISSLSTFAKVNQYGFIETPYRKVVNGLVTDEIRWFSALEEENHYIAAANVPQDENDNIASPLVPARYRGDFVIAPREKITLMEVASNQLVSVAASLIPFLEHDDANRALMGSNMQRQAVPLLRSEAPIVGTGMEKKVARDSGVCVIAKRDGVVESVDSTRIVVRAQDESGVFPDIYRLWKYRRSNQNTSYTQRPIVRPGERVRAGEVIADGPSCDTGELALGKNVIVAFMPWGGYNFEDSILISERVVKEDIFTSIHIEEFECIAREMKLGKEEITRDIPNVGEEALKELDESGVIRIGAEVKSGDILVGKITPKGETQLTPEEKLLRAIFGEKASDVRDTSLRVPPGVSGVVINARVFAKRGVEKDERAKEIEDAERAKFERDRAAEIKIIQDAAYDKIEQLLIGQVTRSRLVDERGRVLIAKGTTILPEHLHAIPRRYWPEIEIENTKDQERIRSILKQLDEQIQSIHATFEEKINKLSRGDELPANVIKMVKVYVAIKRKLQVGDKMAGRHGNKGVISRILPEEDMPYLPDGTPVDVVLNPLGVPSRMNVGQILETHLGWAGYLLGRQIGELIDKKKASAQELRNILLRIYKRGAVRQFVEDLNDEEIFDFANRLRGGLKLASPVFDGAKEEEIKELLALVREIAVHYGLTSPLYHLSASPIGQTVLFDGRTGEVFHRDVTVGVMYILKLHHLVDDKIHARSTGPYSLVTQQPLGGKAQFGGQRLGEMEVWAMEAYGAAYALQEFLTVKSDDVQGRTRMYESIVRGNFQLEPGLPESFKVLMKELQALCLNVELLESYEEASTQSSVDELVAEEE
ncbi:MAG: DNA-directed RNA polymerase subunit beta [Sandaracinaceae bacterium]|nr:DNA-directed RNA polymerase subunit beta [Sandaracinaceae bacterium]